VIQIHLLCFFLHNLRITALLLSCCHCVSRITHEPTSTSTKHDALEVVNFWCWSGPLFHFFHHCVS